MCAGQRPACLENLFDDALQQWQVLAHCHEVPEGLRAGVPDRRGARLTGSAAQGHGLPDPARGGSQRASRGSANSDGQQRLGKDRAWSGDLALCELRRSGPYQGGGAPAHCVGYRLTHC